MTLIGHDLAEASWAHALSSERMHHAWLLAGKKGLGKASFARSAALDLVGSASGKEHPDILILTHGPKDKVEAKKRDNGKPYALARGIKIDQIRSMQQRLTTRPTLGAKRAVIIDPADDMEPSAANALLKSLEEPPQGTYFMLVSHNPARLLPTIRSRCRTLRFPAIDTSTMHDLMRRLSPDAHRADRDAAVAAAAGSPGAALTFLSYDLGKAADLMRRIMTQGDPDFSLRGQLSAFMGNKQDVPRLKSIIDLARGLLAESVPTRTNDPVSLIESHAQLVRLGYEQPIYNYDPGQLAMTIGTLLVQAGAASGSGNG